MNTMSVLIGCGNKNVMITKIFATQRGYMVNLKVAGNFRAARWKPEKPCKKKSSTDTRDTEELNTVIQSHDDV